MPLFIDVEPLSCHATDAALELMHKAQHDGDEGIWAPMDSPLLRRLVELFTQRGLTRLDAVQKAILSWQSGANHKTDTMPAPKPGMMVRWNADELAAVKLYLEVLPPEQWTLDDHMMAVELVVQTYLPADELTTEAQWLATKANLMGKVQANLEKPPTLKQADALLAALPSSVAAAEGMFTFTSAQKATLEYGAARAAENVRAITESVRHQLRQVVMQYAEEQIMGNPGESLQTRLFDTFGQLNRDWRRIAVTEAGECQLQGYVSSLKPGTQVKRVEQYKNACAFCRKIDGVVMEVISPSAPYKDGKKHIWPGKTNVGRSASPRKRVGDLLVPREEHELYWVPAGLAHPHCRGRWVLVTGPDEGDDPDFAKWLSENLA